MAYGPLTVSNGVVYGTSTAGSLLALDASTGEVLYNKDIGPAAGFAPPTIDGKVLYWPSGYFFEKGPFAPAEYTGPARASISSSNKLYALEIDD